MKSLQIAIINHTNQYFEYQNIYYPNNYKSRIPELGISPSLALEYICDISGSDVTEYDIEPLFGSALDFVLEYLTIEQNKTFVFHIDEFGCTVTCHDCALTH